jgi:glycosyltransferase involved in cell wall biosynthesis
LDANLDFTRFAMTFIGNSPIAFKNIRYIPPITSSEVAEELRKHDIFISASHLEACSNAIGEALNCGLIALVRDNSSQPELVVDGRFVFTGTEDVISAVERVSVNLNILRDLRKVETMRDIGDSYLAFADKVWQECHQGSSGKRLSQISALGLKFSEKLIGLRGKVVHRLKRISKSRSGKPK